MMIESRNEVHFYKHDVGARVIADRTYVVFFWYSIRAVAELEENFYFKNTIIEVFSGQGGTVWEAGFIARNFANDGGFFLYCV